MLCVCLRSLDSLSFVFALHRKPYKTVRQLSDVCWGPPSSHLPTDLASLPLGALRSAQRALARAQTEEDQSGSEDERSESEVDSDEALAKGKASRPNAHKPEWSNKPRTDIAKRQNKNA